MIKDGDVKEELAAAGKGEHVVMLGMEDETWGKMSIGLRTQDVQLK
jgi:hypothetical protein